ncbi:MAG: glycosyltransferase [Hamadaea sp.]|uniref:glycosyltransferase n=1 Tax=Hamadaea sp. TaxID=2024425 RepID=UPI0017E0CB59|nr:glycosyltransferase [Hamadaea sp.]NUR71559.1 glycosyltransferase [Hamadaea sp.]NUT17912.1 glycosyltransferase [Hamadaea sp.]
MRIALVSEHASPLAQLGGVDAGGQNVHVAALATALARRGHEVEVFTRRDDPGPPETVESGGFRVVHVPAGPAGPIARDDLLPYMGEFGAWLAARWTGTPPDVVHSHYWMSGVAALRAAEGTPDAGRLPLVSTFHALGAVKKRVQGAADTSPAEREELEPLVAHSADRVIAQCADEVGELLKLGIGRDQIAVVPSGVDLDRFQPGPHGPRLRSPRETPRILAVGRMVPRKGFLDVIKAVRRVPGAYLVIAGGPPKGQLPDDPVARRLLEAAEELGVADRVELLGGVPNDRMPELYRSADLLACTPAYETFGMTPLEAMACGTPVVAYAVGGLADSVAHGVSGLLVAPGDVDGLAKAIRELLTVEPRRYAYAVAGMSQAQARYPWPRVAEQVEAVYRSVIARQLVSLH